MLSLASQAVNNAAAFMAGAVFRFGRVGTELVMIAALIFGICEEAQHHRLDKLKVCFVQDGRCLKFALVLPVALVW